MAVSPPYGGAQSFQAYPSVDTNEATGVNQFFILPFVLLPPNTVLSAPTTERAFITGAVILNGGANPTFTLDNGAKRTSFSAGVAAAFTSIEVPSGVTWVSDSGVFLSQPIPEPSTWALVLAGIALVGLRLRGPQRTQPATASDRPRGGIGVFCPPRQAGAWAGGARPACVLEGARDGAAPRRDARDIFLQAWPVSLATDLRGRDR
jgi:hypothetical protein